MITSLAFTAATSSRRQRLQEAVINEMQLAAMPGLVNLSAHVQGLMQELIVAVPGLQQGNSILITVSPISRPESKQGDQKGQLRHSFWDERFIYRIECYGADFSEPHHGKELAVERTFELSH